MINNVFKIAVTFSMFGLVVNASASQAVDFTDMSGDKIHLSAPAKRIVVIPIPAASMLVGMDESSEKLVGMHPFAKVAAQEGMLGKMFSPVLQVNSNVVGNNFTPNIEALLNVEPNKRRDSWFAERSGTTRCGADCCNTRLWARKLYPRVDPINGTNFRA